MTQPTTAFAEPPIGEDGLIDITAVATRVGGSPEIRPSGIDLAALDAATPAAPVGPLGIPIAAQPVTQSTVAPAQPTAASGPAIATTPAVSDHQRLIAEATQEQRADPDLPEGACRVDLKDRTGQTVVATFTVLHPDDWPSSANADAVNPNAWYGWGRKIFATADDADLWEAIDPTNRQVTRFIADWQIAAGAVAPPKG